MKSIALLILLALSGCTQPENARRVVESAGYTNVVMDGYDWFNCAEDDIYHDKFRATGQNGKPVSGVVCAGLLFKGATIRLD